MHDIFILLFLRKFIWLNRGSQFIFPEPNSSFLYTEHIFVTLSPCGQGEILEKKLDSHKVSPVEFSFSFFMFEGVSPFLYVSDNES